MSRLIRLAALALVALMLQTFAPVPAAAQLGGLVKKAKKAAEGTLPYTPDPAPEFDDQVLEITPDRLLQLVKGFEVEAAHAKTAAREYEEKQLRLETERAAYEKAREAFAKASEKYQACSSKFRDEELKKSQANEAAVEKVLAEMGDEEFADYVQKLAMRGMKIAEETQAGRGNPAEQAAYQRDVAVMQKEQNRRLKTAMAGMAAERERARTEDPRLTAACGKEPEAPKDPDSGLGSGPESVLLEHGANAASLDGKNPSTVAKIRRYQIMRERVIAWHQQGHRPKGIGFSQDEIAALEAASKQVDQALEAMKKAGVSL